MGPYFTHTLEINQEEVIAHAPSGYLAIVDLESYKSFAGKETDHLDMMAHLQKQMSALTAVVWGTPNTILDLRLLLANDHCPMEHMTDAGQSAFASGWVRTNGRLCFTNDERLYDCAHHRTHDLLGNARLPKNSRPHLLNVPPGIYAVHIFYHSPKIIGYGETPIGEAATRSTVILRHYAFPAPRLAPIRLPGFMPQAA